MDPIQFIRGHLGEPATNMEEYDGMKQNLIQLNNDMIQMKGELTQLKSIVTELAKAQAHASVDDTKTTHDDSNQSMTNNVSDDNNHVTMLHDDETLLFDDAVHQTAINSMEQDSAVHVNNNMSADQRKNDEFIMEIVEVDVMSSSQIGKTVDSVQNDEMTSDDVPNTSSPMLAESESEMTTHEYTDSISADLTNQNTSTEAVSIGNGSSSDKFAHSQFYAEMMIDVSQVDDTGSASMSSDGPMASTPKKMTDETHVDAVDSKMVINIEDLPIVMKSDDSADQL